MWPSIALIRRCGYLLIIIPCGFTKPLIRSSSPNWSRKYKVSVTCSLYLNNKIRISREVSEGTRDRISEFSSEGKLHSSSQRWSAKNFFGVQNISYFPPSQHVFFGGVVKNCFNLLYVIVKRRKIRLLVKLLINMPPPQIYIFLPVISI